MLMWCVYDFVYCLTREGWLVWADPPSRGMLLS